MKIFLLKGIRGECADCISFLIFFPSDDVRNKYWNEEDVYTESGKAALEKVRPVIEEMAKFGKIDTKYTDWGIQQYLINEIRKSLRRSHPGVIY